jgi:hypothetical protein
MDTPASTRLSTAFCPARDRKIPVLVRPPSDSPTAEALESVMNAFR